MAYVASGYVAAGYVEADAPATGYPSPSDVRLGVVYGPALEYTGTYTGAIGGPSVQDIALAVIAQLQSTTIPVDIKKMNGATLVGDGTPANQWRGA